MNEPVFAYEATFHEDALSIPVDDLRGNFKERVGFDKATITDRSSALYNPTPEASHSPVKTSSLIEVNTCKVQLAKVSTLKSIKTLTAVKLS